MRIATYYDIKVSHDTAPDNRAIPYIAAALLGATGLVTLTGGAIGIAMAGTAFSISQGAIALTGASAGTAVVHKLIN